MSKHNEVCRLVWILNIFSNIFALKLFNRSTTIWLNQKKINNQYYQMTTALKVKLKIAAIKICDQIKKAKIQDKIFSSSY